MFAVPELTVPSPASYRRLPLAALVRAVAADVESWRPIVRFEPDAPVRLPLAVPDPDVELWLTGWLPGQSAEPVPAGRGHGAFAIAGGLLTEYSASGSRTLLAGQTRVFGPGYTHRLANTGSQPAISVHGLS